VLAVIASFMVIGAVPAGAAISTTTSCPSTIPNAAFTDLGGLDATTVDAIDCLVHYGITQGTSATTFSPNGSVTRWQMALFLTRQAVDHGLALGDGATQGFTDISGLDAATQTAINQLKQLGITSGTSATTFDPNGLVSRWQMALFMTRLAVKAGFTLGSGADQGFTDLTGLDAATVTAINQAKQAGIADGTSATTFVPFANTLRWHMALFLTRVLAVDGVVPAGLGNIVTAQDSATNKTTVADKAQGKEVVITYANTDKFTVDGTAATVGSYESSVTVGDVLSVAAGTPQTLVLTNKTAASYTNGVISNVLTGADTYQITEPISGVVLNTVNYSGVFTLYTSDGAGQSIAAFELDIQAGDSVTSTGTGADAANIRTIALTNASITGTVSAVGVGGAGNFKVGAFVDVFNAVATDGLTVDGAAATEAVFEAAATGLSNGDSATLSKKGGKLTVALVNKASAPITGKVLNNNGVGVDTVEVDVAGVNTNLSYAGDAAPIVNGLLDNIAGLEAVLSAGDTFTIVVADGMINTADQVTLTDGDFSGTPAAINAAGDTVAIEFTASGPDTESISYTAVAPADLPHIVGTSVTYTVGTNTAATVLAFEAAVANAILNGGTVSVADTGTVVVWTVK
jgi:hypothetical protein